MPFLWVTIKQDVDDLVEDVRSWRLSSSDWPLVERLVEQARAGAAIRDPAVLAQAVADIELLAPLAAVNRPGDDVTGHPIRLPELMALLAQEVRLLAKSDVDGPALPEPTVGTDASPTDQ